MRLSRRGRAVLVTLALLAALVAGMTADSWNPCAGDYVCVVTR